ncbi:MAG: universal stress protein [Planctomycetes bacterium]|nr:universal stress protein [Planctomycetota bacterium]
MTSPAPPSPRPPSRSRSDDFLDLVRRGRRGRLKLYVGFAAGVGKTCRMLEEAQALRAKGVDVVVGFVETHGRADTEARIAGLEVIPRLRVEHRGLTVEEMDLDAILRRMPEVCVIDEIPHTNLPGSKHLRRFEDVEEILDAGVHVIAALNVQHVESLVDLVRGVTGVTVRETVPDAFLRLADQIVNVDLSAEDLLERIRAGKVYPQDRVPTALGAFFTQENLAALREMALREVADTLGRAAPQHSGEAAAAAAARNVSARVLVCLSSASPRAGPMLRRAARIAGRLNTSWFAIHVETPSEAPDRIDAEAQRKLIRSVDLARELGAEVAVIRSRDPVAAVVDFARSHGVAHVIVGRSGKPAWLRTFRPTFVDRLLAEAHDLDVHVVAADLPEDAK